MQRSYLLLAAVVMLASLPLSACERKTAEYRSAGHDEPARVEPIEGSSISRVILTDEAAARLDVQTEPVREVAYAGQPRTAVPYAAVLYDLEGNTWTYTSPEPLTFVRHSISVLSIDGDLVILSDGPTAGTPVVTLGVPELYGTEFEFSPE